MKDAPYTIAIVLDPKFGIRLKDVAARFDLWTVSSEINRPVVEQLRREDHDVSMWTSDLFMGTTVEDWRAVLQNVEDNHGPYSHNPPVTILEIYGAILTDDMRRELGHYGYDTFEPTPDGFRATRSAASIH